MDLVPLADYKPSGATYAKAPLGIIFNPGLCHNCGNPVHWTTANKIAELPGDDIESQLRTTNFLAREACAKQALFTRCLR